jgi:hypothetical protein
MVNYCLNKGNFFVNSLFSHKLPNGPVIPPKTRKSPGMIHYVDFKGGIRGITSLPRPSGPPEGWSAAEPRGRIPRVEGGT